MNQIKLKANAKINLSLDVVKLLDDGYHQLDMIMQSIDLADIITITVSDRPGIRLACTDSRVPTDGINLIVRAARLILEKCRPDTLRPGDLEGDAAKNASDSLSGRYNPSIGLDIHLEKHIPSAAGLAGGSADCAATLLGINRLLDLGLTDYELWRMGLSLGADVPFCLVGGTKRCRGIGELISPLEYPFHRFLLLAKPVEGASTGEIFGRIDRRGLYYHPPTDLLIKALSEANERPFFRYMGNSLMEVTLELLPVIRELIAAMEACGAARAMMSGSGPTVFGIFRDADHAGKAQRLIERLGAERGYELDILEQCSFADTGIEYL